EHDDDATGHIFAAMVASALDHGGCAGITHREPLAGNAAEITFAVGSAVEHRIADDDRLFRNDARIGLRPDDQAAARQALAHIIVRITLELEGDAARKPGAERLAGGADEAHVDGVVRKPRVSVTLGDLAGQHSAGGAIDVLDDALQAHRRTAVERGLRLGDQLAVEDVLDLV